MDTWKEGASILFRIGISGHQLDMPHQLPYVILLYPDFHSLCFFVCWHNRIVRDPTSKDYLEEHTRVLNPKHSEECFWVWVFDKCYYSTGWIVHLVCHRLSQTIKTCFSGHCRDKKQETGHNAITWDDWMKDKYNKIKIPFTRKIHSFCTTPNLLSQQKSFSTKILLLHSKEACLTCTNLGQKFLPL